MSIYTETELKEAIEQWKTALSLCATGKSYQIDGRTLTRYDLAEIRAHLSWLQSQLDLAQGRRVVCVRPMIRR